MRIFLSFLLAVFLGACSDKPREDDILARVNGEPITVKEFVDLYETLKPKDLGQSSERYEIRNLVLKTLIRRKVILTEAEKKNITISEGELETGIKKIKEDYTAGSFEQSLLEQMVDEKTWRERIKETLLMEKLFEESKPVIPAPRDDEALEFYEKNRLQFLRPAVAQALHIVVPSLDKAKEIRKQLKTNPQSFLKLARENSTGPEAQQDAMITIEKDAMPEEIDRALFEGKIQEISDVIQSPYGFHIFKVLKRTPSLNMDFRQVRPQIISRLSADKRREWILLFEERLIRKAEIEYDDSAIRGLL